MASWCVVWAFGELGWWMDGSMDEVGGERLS